MPLRDPVRRKKKKRKKKKKLTIRIPPMPPGNLPTIADGRPHLMGRHVLASPQLAGDADGEVQGVVVEVAVVVPGLLMELAAVREEGDGRLGVQRHGFGWGDVLVGCGRRSGFLVLVRRRSALVLLLGCWPGGLAGLLVGRSGLLSGSAGFFFGGATGRILAKMVAVSSLSAVTVTGFPPVTVTTGCPAVIVTGCLVTVTGSPALTVTGSLVTVTG